MNPNDLVSATETLAVNRRNMDEMVSLVEALVINKVRIEKIRSELKDHEHVKVLDQELRIITEIQESIQKVRMLPVGTIQSRLEEHMALLEKTYGGMGVLTWHGGETTAENSQLPLLERTIRCFLDHIASVWEKSPPSGKQVQLTASADSKNLTVCLSYEEKALSQKLIGMSKESLELVSMDDSEVGKFLETFALLDFSEELMSVRSEFIRWDGSLAFAGLPDDICEIRMTIPRTSSILQGMLVMIGGQTFAIPMDFIETIMQAESVTIQESHKRGMILYLDTVVPVIRSSELLEMKESFPQSSILIVSANGKRGALLVDSVIDQTDMVIKPKHSVLGEVSELKGTTILGDGLVTLVLNIPAILTGM